MFGTNGRVRVTVAALSCEHTSVIGTQLSSQQALVPTGTWASALAISPNVSTAICGLGLGLGLCVSNAFCGLGLGLGISVSNAICVLTNTVTARLRWCSGRGVAHLERLVLPTLVAEDFGRAALNPDEPVCRAVQAVLAAALAPVAVKPLASLRSQRRVRVARTRRIANGPRRCLPPRSPVGCVPSWTTFDHGHFWVQVGGDGQAVYPSPP